MTRWLALLALAVLAIGGFLLCGGRVEELAPVDLPEATARETPALESRLDSPERHDPRREAPDEAPSDANERAPESSRTAADPVLVGRLVLADGMPYTDQTLQLSITRGAGERLRSQPVESDGDGRVTFRLANVADPLDGLRLTIRERGRLPRPLTASIDLPPLRRGATTSLGDVSLRRHAIGVTCRLVDRDRRPIVAPDLLGPDVELWGPAGLVRHDDERERESGVVLQFDGGEESGWLTLDPRGMSIVPEPWFVDPLQPGAERRAVGGRTGVAVRAGDDVSLVVAHGGTIRGSVVRDGEGDVPVDRIRVRATEDVEPVTWGREVDEQVAYSEIEEDGRFEVEGVDAGLRRVEFLSGQLVLFAVDDLEVRLEEVVHDPRLQNVDLRRFVRRCALRVVDPQGALVPEAAAFVWQDGSCAEFPRAGEEIRIVVPADTMTAPGVPDAQVIVHAPGFVPERIGLPHGDETVTLEPAISIRARTAAPFDGDIGSHGFWLRLRRVDGPDEASWLWATELPFGWDGTEPAELTAPGPGRYELEVMVKMRMGTLFGTTPSDRYVGTGVFVEVGPEHAASPLVIDVPDDLVRFDT